MTPTRSDEYIAANLGLPFKATVAASVKSVVGAFRTVVRSGFGPASLSRQAILENTSPVAKKLFDLTDEQAMLILDGTYVRHQKSSNNEYQTRSYSGQKEVPLCKPFTICTTNGLIIDFAGPYAAKYNDASIVKEVFKNSDLRALLKPNDVLVVDRGFRDAVAFLNGLGYVVKIPALLERGQSQLPTEKANESCRVTKVRWVVEAYHGIVFGKFKLLKHTLDNKMLTKAGQLCRIAGYLQNTYGTYIRTYIHTYIHTEYIRNLDRRNRSRWSFAAYG